MLNLTSGKRKRQICRLGMTLVELLMATAATAIIGMGLASLAIAVYAGNEYVSGRTSTAQHGRVCLERIRRHIDHAHANEAFPGCVVFAETVGNDSFPEILVLWVPTTTAANPTGLPTVGELIVIAPDPRNPQRLLECTRREVTTANAPPLSNVAAWFTLIDQFRSSSSDAVRTELTDLLRPVPISRDRTLGAVRFNVRMTPSETDWISYRAGTTAWSALNWPLDFRGADVGLRRVTCETELQLLPKGAQDAEAIPFFGASALTYSLAK